MNRNNPEEEAALSHPAETNPEETYLMSHHTVTKRRE